MAKQSQVSIAAQDDLYNWVFVDQSDFELDGDDSIFEVEGVDLVESIDSLSSYSLSSAEDEEEGGHTNDLGAHDGEDEALMKSLSPSALPPYNVHPRDAVDLCRSIDLGNDIDFHMYYDGGHQYPNSSEEEDEVDLGYDMDDELVPWEVKDRFERQRIRKLGKRAFAKMTKSKKSILLYTKPGCVRGKHGLGLKAY